MKTVLFAAKKTVGDISIMLMRESLLGSPCWEVYYRMSDTPWLYAFGLPTETTTEADAWTIAEGNVENYMDMFVV